MAISDESSGGGNGCAGGNRCDAAPASSRFRRAALSNRAGRYRRRCGGGEGVRRYSAYENDTDTTDGNGLPSHSIALVVEGGDAERIAQAIAAKKTPGAGTYGTTTTLIHDRYGIEHPIRFFRP